MGEALGAVGRAQLWRWSQWGKVALLEAWGGLLRREQSKGASLRKEETLAESLRLEKTSKIIKSNCQATVAGRSYA